MQAATQRRCRQLESRQTQQPPEDLFSPLLTPRLKLDTLWKSGLSSLKKSLSYSRGLYLGAVL